jgi:superfamily II DNA/RNA helicase
VSFNETDMKTQEPTDRTPDAEQDGADSSETTFGDLGVSDVFVAALEAQGILAPFPIQELTIPLCLKGADVIGQARTGTGKTLAFGLPLLESVAAGAGHVQALVVTPTRELCVQVAADLAEAGTTAGVSVLTVYGGVPLDPQRDALRAREVDVVVGTPGRLLDHVRRGHLRLGEVRMLVLDEADRMLDMGFIPDIERIVSECNDDRQTLLFSATMPSEIVGLGRRYMRSPTFINAETERETSAPPETDQHFFVVHRMDKPRVLARILQSPHAELCAVFVRTKRMADRLVDELRGLGLNASPIHGDLRQARRERNLERFRSGHSEVLVATEVAARGLDIEGVTHVINYDIPDDEKMYLHRIGRTGRAGAAGVAVTFAQHDEVERLNAIRKRVGAKDVEVHEVFSTSDLITDLFELPNDTPWDHLGTDEEPWSRAAQRSQEPGEEPAEEDNADAGEAGLDAGEESGVEADEAGLDADEAGVDAGETSADTGEEAGVDAAEAGADAGETGLDAGEAGADADPDAAASEERPARSRSRSRRTPAHRGPDSSDGDDRDRGRGGQRSDRSSGGVTPLPAADADEPVRARTREREAPPSRNRSGRGRDRKARTRGRSDRSGGRQGGDGGGRERARGNGDRRGNDRRRDDQGNDDRGRRARDDAGTEPTEPGAPARGEGQPTLSRRVKVENVP